MRSRDVVVPILIAGLAAGCAASHAPTGYLPKPAEAPWNPRGGWITVQYGDSADEWVLDGELVAVEGDSVYVLTGEGLEAAPAAGVRRAELWGYQSEHGRLAAWTVVGTLSCASNGIVAVLSAPVWAISGTLSTASQSRAPRLTRPSDPWARFRSYARFPQGLPPGLDRGSLRPWRF